MCYTTKCLLQNNYLQVYTKSLHSKIVYYYVKFVKTKRRRNILDFGKYSIHFRINELGAP